MISIFQIKAARSLVGLTQRQLAKLSGLSLTTISNLESEVVTPRDRSLTILQATLEKVGIEFIDGPGVRLRQEIFESFIFDGKSFVDRHTDDILHSVPKGGFIYVCSSDERKVKHHSSDQDQKYQNFIRTMGIDEKILLPEGDTFFLSPRQAYRWIPKIAIGDLHWMVYGDKIAFYFWKKPHRAFVIRNPSLAEAYRRQFLFLWYNAQKPK